MIKDRKFKQSPILLIYNSIALIPIGLLLMGLYSEYKSLEINFTSLSYVIALLYVGVFLAHLILSKNKIINITTVILSSIIYLYAIIGIFISNSVPSFFPVQDPSASYTIMQRNDYFILKYQNSASSDNNMYEECIFQDHKRICTKKYIHDFEVMIGNSPVDLSSYLGTNVIVDGSFRYIKQQCIVNNCRDLGNYAGFDIKSIKINK